MRKLITFVLLTILVMLPIANAAMASEPEMPTIRLITVLIDEKKSGTVKGFLETDVEPYIHDGVTLVPLRAIAEKFAYQVDYQSGEEKIVITNTIGSELILFINSCDVVRNGTMSSMSQPPMIKDGRTFVPLRYVSEFFGLTISWRSNYTNTIHRIWLSEVGFLTSDDVKVDSNYRQYFPDYAPPGLVFYELTENGKTSRGIGINDNTDKIFSAYGPVHGTSALGNGLSEIKYFSESAPFEDSEYFIDFFIKDDKVTRVIMMIY